MGNKMLIDAAHPEETRVVVLRGNRIEEFDFEAASKKQLRGNIYLAKVTRVEPSLQAAFIEYGGNRHGFLAFSEIHPDYYQIPVADRQALLEDEARSADEDEEEQPRQSSRGSSGGGNGNGHRRSRRHRRGDQGGAEKRSRNPDDAVATEEVPQAEHAPAEFDAHEAVATTDEGPAIAGMSEAPLAEDAADDIRGAEPTEAEPHAADAPDHHEHGVDSADPHEHAADQHEMDDAGTVTVLEGGEESPVEAAQDADHEADHDAAAEAGQAGEPHHDDEPVEQLGGDALEDVPHRVNRPRRHYKIQEVIKRRQVLLVQVVKEERGNKGAALTTYLSLAGRYSVLMPNTARGGGISRKIVDPEDRKRLKAIAQELEVPDGMGIILRTAGASRGMPEVKRDFEYLMRMWETVRETTLSSTAPTLVYEEGSLIKRSIRDLFTKDVDEVVVSGDEGYREAKEFMRLLMPNQVRNVVAYRDPQPIFAKSGAEAQLDAMFSNQVVLKSGGYLVINQTEALVAIDVNSGRSTREHNIEDTALRTNLEAADEVARQLRLRDLAGLIVVDFIDMEEGRNDRAVERRLKDALKNDRARIQIGRISHFGLLEMSRQRMRTGVLEGSTVMCPHCAGSGMVRSVSSMALHVLRLLEDTLIRSAAHNLIARTRSEVALYILNQKRANMLDLESRFGVAITVLSDPAMTGMVYHAIERGSEATPPAFLPFRPEAADDAAEEAPEGEIDGGTEEDGEEMPGEEAAPSHAQTSQQPREVVTGEDGGRRKRRRRRRRGRDGLEQSHRNGAQPQGDDGEHTAFDAATAEETDEVAALTEVEGGFMPETGFLPEASESGSGEAAPMVDAPGTEAVSSEGVAPLAPTPAADDEEPTAAPEADTAEAPRRRRPRRARGAAEAPSGEAEAVVEEAAPAKRPRRSRSRAAELPLDSEAQPSADRDAGADTVKARPAPAAPEPELPLEPAAAPAAEAAPQVPEPDADPDRPKRSGWWQRAKATFSAGS